MSAPRYTEPGGTLLLDDVVVGQCYLTISEYPEYYFPPIEYFRQTTPDPPRTFEVPLSIAAGANTVTFVMRLSARIEGYVRDSTSGGIANVRVTANAMETPRTCFGVTDAAGYYSLRCPVGTQRLRIGLEQDHPFVRFARPPPRDVDVSAGVRRREDFVLEHHPGRITGSVVDQDGLPFAGLQVLSYYLPEEGEAPNGDRLRSTWKDHVLSVETANDGSFKLDGLPLHRIALQIAPEGYKPVGKGVLGMIVPRSIIDLARTPQVELGRIVACRSRPFYIRGEIMINGGWKSGHPSAASSLKLTVILHEGIRRSKPAEDGVDLVGSGVDRLSFSWACETPEEVVGFLLRDNEGTEALYTVLPWPNGVEEVVWSYPQ